jgi:ATP-binding cassette subfamily B protein
MADAQQSTQQDDDVIGKAYDSRLMRRLLVYLRPYRLQVGVSLVAILFTAFADVLGPYLTKVAVDLYMTPSSAADTSLWTHHLSRNAITGVSEIAGIYFGSLVFIYFLAFVQTYLMQWTGQKVMYDLRSQIFRHIQRMHVAFFDRNPTGRLVTRVTYDVDALNEMFTSGVVSIFEDVLVLAGIVFVMLRMSWWLALLAFSVLPLIFVATQIFRKFVRESYRRIRTAIARINSYLQEHVSGMSVVQLFNREQRAFQDFENVNREHMKAFKDAILAYALYYPVVEILSSIAVAIIIWRGGGGARSRWACW